MANQKSKTGWNLENSYAKLPEIFFSILTPSPVESPKLRVLNYSLAESLGLEIDYLKSKEGVEVLAGNDVPKGSKPLAQAYAGHQFGHFTMLGDGRAMLIGEQITPAGEKLDIQLKGSGRTPYSRGGDGRATLGPMLREYIISEAMHGFGIPTTRSLAVITTGESVVRETMLSGAIMTRVASSHIRFGTFEYAAKWGGTNELKALADYTINRHFPHIKDDDNIYLSLLKEVIKRQAKLTSKWQLVGFIHGVMNTDNMTIAGETIDYGPCAFMDSYDPKTVFSSIDVHARYAYGNQPNITGWNLARFAESLLPILSPNHDEAVRLAQNAISEFGDLYQSNWLSGMRAKLGIFNEEEQDKSLIEELLAIMYKYSADYTNTFISLTFDKVEDTDLFKSKEFIHWNNKWKARLGRQDEPKSALHDLMKTSNPALIPRNHRVEEALDAAVKQGDYSVMEKLIKAILNPYAHSPEQVEYSTLPEKQICGYQTFCGT